ncbi:MAG: hypothetical protein JSS27_06355 [Planctomycetes bacterium]|nr:hypothetical protein [Planctomycetota bacterium]
MRRLALLALVLLATGCQFLPQISRQPAVHNPLPQLSKIAVASFFNHSTEPTVDGAKFALAYANELQKIPGYEVIPLSRVEYVRRAYGLTLANAQEARLLAQLLEADAIAIGVVTDYSPYYPPRIGMHVEWYAANPGFHPIPPGYGLPWGTPEEEEIPPPLVFEARMALAREQMKTQEPAYQPLNSPPPAPLSPALPAPETSASGKASGDKPAEVKPASDGVKTATLTSHEQPAAEEVQALGAAGAPVVLPAGPLPPDWPDPRGFTPAPPVPVRPATIESKEPVMRHTKIYNGNNSDVTEALSTYYYYADDARFGGWQAYMQRSDDFVRFCCHAHICEMLTARGGAGQSRVVWRWPTGR